MAEEISGLTFLKIRQNPNFNGGSFIKWVETIAHNAYVDYLRTLELDPSDLTKQNKIKATKEARKKTLIDKTKIVIDDLGGKKTILPYIEPIDESRVYIDQISLTNYGDDSDDDTQNDIYSMGLNSESLIDLQDCLFKKQGRLAETYPKIARVISYLLEGLANEEIAELMDNKSKNFAEFISYSRKQFMHYAEECFE
jgi:DNA-directed RNA polymerase specialized sigma24 family protein